MKQTAQIILLSALLLGLSLPANAVETDGKTWANQSEEFKRGYSAGHLDTQTTWGMSLIPGGPLSEERARTSEVIGLVARYMALCVRQKGISFDELKKLTEEQKRGQAE